MIVRSTRRQAPINHRGPVATPGRSPGRTPSARGGEGESPACEAHVFLSPEWIQDVVQAARVAGRTDVYFRNLAGDLSFRLIYTVRDIPDLLKKHYGGHGQVAIFVELQDGVVRESLVGEDLRERKIHLRITSNYQVARNLFVGKGGLMGSFLRGNLKVEPADGFHRWPQLATKSLLAAKVFLQLARKVPTTFVS